MSTPTISRRTAWARLVVAMAEGLPDPQEVSFHPDGDMIHVKVDSPEAVAQWAAHFDAPVDAPFESNEPGKWIHNASTSTMRGGWHGFYVNVRAYVPGPAEVAPVDDDLSAVRALADQDITRGGGEVAGSGGAPGSATTPGEWVPPRLVMPAPITDRALRGDA